MSKALKRAAKEVGVQLDGWNLRDLEDAIAAEAERLVDHVRGMDSDDIRDVKARARLLESASTCLTALAESKNKRVKAIDSLYKAAELQYKLSPRQQTQGLVFTPGEDAREILTEVLMGRATALLPPAVEVEAEVVDERP